MDNHTNERLEHEKKLSYNELARLYVSPPVVVVLVVVVVFVVASLVANSSNYSKSKSNNNDNTQKPATKLCTPFALICTCSFPVAQVRPLDYLKLI